MYTHLLLISTVQFSRAYCSFFYYNIFIVSEQVFLRFFMNLSRHARMCNSSHHLQDATEKLFLYTLYSRLKQIKTLYIVLLYAKYRLFQWRPYRGEGILATVVKIFHNLCQKNITYFHIRNGKHERICIFSSGLCEISRSKKNTPQVFNRSIHILICQFLMNLLYNCFSCYQFLNFLSDRSLSVS